MNEVKGIDHVKTSRIAAVLSAAALAVACTPAAPPKVSPKTEDDKNVYAVKPDGLRKWAFATGGGLNVNSPALGNSVKRSTDSGASGRPSAQRAVTLPVARTGCG